MVADVSQDELVAEIHASGVRLVMAVTGGGSQAISALLTVPGASRSVLAATVPYAPEALTEWLGARPEEFCSSWTARAMAMAAFLKAREYDPAGPTCGIACTASLASDRPKRGAHRLHLAYQSSTTTAAQSVELVKGRRSRAEEETVAAALVLNLIAEATGAGGRLPTGLAPDETLSSARDCGAGRSARSAGRANEYRGARRGGADDRPRAIFPGAFNPLHAGHRRMAEAAARMLGERVDYEIAIANVDKPPLDFIEIDARARQFVPEEGVWFTRAPRFIDKANLFSGVTFVVGADTIARVGEARYYNGDEAELRAAIEHLRARGCRFLVFGRLVDGTFRGLADLAIPPALSRDLPARAAGGVSSRHFVRRN